VNSYRDIVEFLLARKLVSRPALIRHGFRIEDVSRRNYNMRLEIAPDRGYFIKIGADADRSRTLEREAQTYRFLRSRAPGATLLPRLRLFDREASVVVLELLGRENLKDLCMRRRSFGTGRMRALGRSVGRLHRQLSMAGPRRWGVFHPLPFHLTMPPKWFVETCSPASVELLRMVQGSPTLNYELAKMAECWNERVREEPHLVHGDLRLENCCIARRSKQIRIVDWELAGFGDPLWDAGAVLADLASSWLMSVPIPTGSEPADGIADAAIPIDMLRSAGREFWNAYAAARGLKDERAQALLDATRYAAARLLQLAYEHLQGYAELTLHGVGHAQLSENLIRRPIDGAAQVLGIAA
jgi:hypothetical protein